MDGKCSEQKRELLEHYSSLKLEEKELKKKQSSLRERIWLAELRLCCYFPGDNDIKKIKKRVEKRIKKSLPK